jgi:cobalt-zinc-cadmium efflux system membrane fusion protein
MPVSAAAAGILVSCLSLVGACSKTAPPNVEATASQSTAAEAAVELTADQLKTLHIETVGLYAFPEDKEAVGNVDFAEDVAIVEAESTLVGAAAADTLSRQTVARLRDLHDNNGGIAEKELEQAVSQQEASAAAVAAARSALRALGESDAQVEAIATSRQVRNPGSKMKWMVASITETDTPLIRTGQRVEARIAAHPGALFRGTVAKVYAVVDPTTHRSRARCHIADPMNELRPGMLASLAIRVRDALPTPAIPEDAVVRQGDGTLTVWVTTDRHRFVQTTVKTGLRRDGNVQVLEGLRSGESVVTEGGIFLSNLLQAPPSD